MAKYGVNYYGASKYGALTKLVYSVEPMAILVLDFTRVYVAWQTPRGTFSRVRLVRNQAGYPETAEDGVIIFDEFATSGNVSRSDIIDGEDNPTDIPFVPGRQTYYRFFIFTDQKVWRIAGSITTVVPSNHQTQDLFINTLPRVYTTQEQSPLGAVDTNADLYKFTDGLMFTQEEAMTYLDLLRPTHTGLEAPAELLAAYRSNYGLTPEPLLPTKNQKRLIREAQYMYSRKGTALSLGTYVESLTNFNPELTVSSNLLLSVQDSTFYLSIGNWTATSATISASNEQVPDTTTVNQLDHVYTCKIVAAGSGSIKLGNTMPITKGVPVNPSTEYTVSCKLKSPSSAGTITLSAIFYDRKGTVTGSTSSATGVSANNTWKSSSKTFTTPTDAYYVSLQIAYSAAGTYYIDEVCLQLGSAVNYEEARAIDVFLNPTKTNFIKNPSFEVDSSTWALSGATFTQNASVPTYGYSGNYSGRFVVTNPWSITTNYEIPVIPGKYYTASASIKALAALSANFKITFYDDSDVVVDTVTQTISVTTSFANFTLTGLTDSSSDASYAKVSFYGTTAGTINLDLIQFEQSQRATDYFDGSLPSEFGAVWESTANNSYTHLYPSKIQKIRRLSQTIADWIPMNTFWVIRSYDGVEFTNLTV